MSTAEDRAAIAGAANTVTGVKCSPGFKQLTRPGDAVVRLDNLTRSVDGFGFMVTWQVMVAVSQDLAAASTWLDTHGADLIDALSAELVVTRVAPVELVMDTGRIPVVMFEGTRAA